MRLSALGDIVVSASVLGFLREFLDKVSEKTQSKWQIEWFVDERFSGILRDSPCISKLHSLPFKKYLKSPFGIYKIYRYMRKCGEFDIVIDMQGLLKSALVGRMLRTKRFVGFSGRGCRERMASALYSQCVDISYESNILVRNFVLVFSTADGDLQEILKDILQDNNTESIENSIMKLPQFRSALTLRSAGFGIECLNLAIFSDNFLAHKKATLQSNSQKFPIALLESKKFLFVIEASIAEKIYPIDKFLTLAQMLKNHYDKVDIYVIWHSNEKGANALIAGLESQNINAIKLPPLDFNSIKFTLKNMDMIIGGDTGITHLSWALGIKTITLLGNQLESSGKNMRHTRLKRILLGNPYILSESQTFEIASIAPSAIFECIKAQLIK